MKLSDLDFDYPQELIASEPSYPCRVMWVEQSKPKEMEWRQFLESFVSGDVLVLNETKVVPRRVFAKGEKLEFEILFLNPEPGELGKNVWSVLFPASRLKNQEQLLLPGNIRAHLQERGRVQKLSLSAAIDDDYFFRYGEMPLPPYIQEVRRERHTREGDKNWYQTSWALNPGSAAAPTASLHFKPEDIHYLKSRGVEVLHLTLHVGLGTFLPVTVEEIKNHPMHFEPFRVPKATWQKVREAVGRGRRVFALGSTVVRTLETLALHEVGILSAPTAQNLKIQVKDNEIEGSTNLLIVPGFDFRVVSGVLTNFHQPRSTLLAMMFAYAGREVVLECYAWAIEKRFRLFSYGDFSVWMGSQKRAMDWLKGLEFE